jgi:putative ABC transport system substrate-binding protein
MFRLRRLAAVFIFWGLAVHGAAAEEPGSALRLGIAWQGESHMQDRTAAGLAEVLETEAPEIEIEWRRALPSLLALDQTAREFQTNKDAMVLLRSTGAAYLGHHPPTIPTFIGGCNNPVILGAVPDLEQPGGMITGVTYVLSHHDVIKTFKKVLPLESVLMIYQIDHPGGAIDRVGVRAACEEFGIEFYEEGCRTHEYRQAIIRRNAGQVSAIILINNSVVADFPAEAVAAAGETPILGYTREIVAGGALAALAADDMKLGRYLGQSIIEVMVEGRDPGTINVRTDEKPILHLNMDTAVRLGVQVSQAVLKTAEIVRDPELVPESEAESETESEDEEEAR